MTKPSPKKPAKAGTKKVSALPRPTRSAASSRAEIVSPARRQSTTLETEARFAEVLALIEAARRRAYGRRMSRSLLKRSSATQLEELPHELLASLIAVVDGE